MSLHEKINFNFPREVYTQILRYLEDAVDPSTWGTSPKMNVLRLYIDGQSMLDASVIDLMNNCLRERGLPPVYNIIAFIRNKDQGEYNSCHTDMVEHCTFKSSLVFPMLGAKDLFVYWSDGDYLLEWATNEETGIKHTNLIWKRYSTRKVVEEYELLYPTVVAVDVPHGLFTRNTKRGVIFTVRLTENLSVQEIASILNK